MPARSFGYPLVFGYPQAGEGRIHSNYLSRACRAVAHPRVSAPDCEIRSNRANDRAGNPAVGSAAPFHTIPPDRLVTGPLYDWMDCVTRAFA